LSPTEFQGGRKTFSLLKCFYSLPTLFINLNMICMGRPLIIAWVKSTCPGIGKTDMAIEVLLLGVEKFFQ
jgi:hypothetical protein